jgi:hypothetical protein
MKPKEFADGLRKSAELLGTNRAGLLPVLAGVFDASSAATVAATLTRLEKARVAPPAGYPSVGEAIGSLPALLKYLKSVGKPPFVKDLELVAGKLATVPHADLHAFVSSAVAELTKPPKRPPVLKEGVVQHHLTQLEKTLGEDVAFKAAYKELEEDPNVGALEIAALAKRFTDTAIKARSAALKKIWARHHSLMVFKAKSDSRDGRSAA